MAKDKPILLVSSQLDEKTSKAQIQKSLDKIGKNLKLTIGVDKSGNSDISKQVKGVKDLNTATKGYTQGLNNLIHLMKTKQITDDKALANLNKLRQMQDFNNLSQKQQIALVSAMEKANNNYTKSVDARVNAEKKINEEAKKKAQIQSNQQIKVADRTQEKYLDVKNLAEISKKEGEILLKNINKYQVSQDQKREAEGYLNVLKSINVTQDMSEKQLKEQARLIQLNKKELQTVYSDVRATGRGALNFGVMMENAVKSLAVWMGASTLFFQLIRGVQGGIQAVFDLDKAMTELRKTTDASEEELSRFVKTSYEIADALAATNIQVIEATSIFSKMGYALDEASDLGQLAVKLQTVGDGMGSMEETANSLVAVLKGFGVDENSAVAVSAKRVDQLNEVSNKMAVSTGDLTSGLERASAAMAISGNTFEQTTALLTAGTEVLRNSEMVARGLVTSSQRIYDQGADALERWGIATVNANGSVRSTFEILTDLHEIFPTLTEDQQRWTLTQIAGKDQFKTLSSVMQNWNSVSKTMEAQMNANGSATEELNRKLESLEGRVNKFTNATAKFWNEAIDSTFVKSVISSATVLVEAFGNLNTATGGLLLPLSILGVTLKAIFGQDVISMVYKLVTAIAGLTPVGYGASAAFQVMNMSLKAFQITLGVVGVALVGLSALYGAHVNAVEKARVETENFEKAQKSLNEELSKGDEATKNKVNEINHLVNQYDELIERQKELTKQQQEADKLNNRGRRNERDRSQSAEYKENAKAIEELKNKFKELGITVSDARLKIEQGREALANIKKEIDTNGWSFDQLSESISKSNEAYTLLEDAQIEFAESGYLSQDTIKALNDKFGDFVDITKLSEKGIINFINTEKEAIKVSIKNDIALTDEKIASAKKRIEALLIEQQLAESILANDPSNIGAMHKQYAAIRGLRATGADSLSAQLSNLQSNKAMLENSLKEIEGIESKSDEKSKSKKDKDKITLMTQLEKQLEANNHQLAIQKELTSQIAEDDPKKLDSIKQEIALYQQRQNLLHLQANAVRAEQASIMAKGKLTDADKKRLEELQSQLYQYGQEWTSLKGDIINANKAVQDYYDNAKKIADEKFKADLEFTKDQIEEIIDALQDGLKGALEATEQSIKDEAEASEKYYNDKIQSIKDSIDKIEEQNEITQEQINLQEKLMELEKLRQQRLNILSQKNVRFLVGNEFQFIADPLALQENAEAIANAEKDLSDTRQTIADKERKRQADAEIKSLEEQKDKSKQLYDQRLKDFKTYSDGVLNELKSSNGLTVIEQDTLYNTLKKSDESYFTNKLSYVQEMASKIRAEMNSIGQIDYALGGLDTSYKPKSLIAPQSINSAGLQISPSVRTPLSSLGETKPNIVKNSSNSSSTSISIGNINMPSTVRDSGGFVKELERLSQTRR